MPRYPHLKLSENIIGKARLPGGGGQSQQTRDNKINRDDHSANLLVGANSLIDQWASHIAEREAIGLAPIGADEPPLFIQVDPQWMKLVDFSLQNFGIEIISEEEGGFIVGASLDNLRSLEAKIKAFAVGEYGSGKIAELWKIVTGNRGEWKPKHILSPELLEKWSSIDDNKIYELEVSIAFDKPMGTKPDPSKKGGPTRLKKYNQELIERDDKLIERQSQFSDFIKFYGGELLSSFIELEDSFGCKLSLNGKGLKDLVINYPFVFEVAEAEEIGGINATEEDTFDGDFTIVPPDKDAPEVAIIDSGIMENHRCLEAAVNPLKSKSYIADDSSVADKVRNGGHGTRVAGAVLYPNGISGIMGHYQLPCFIRNLRILDEDNELKHLYPAELMEKIVTENDGCRVYNLSVNSKAPFRKQHMSSWAATIDKLIHEKDVLFVVSAGNFPVSGIRLYLNNGIGYPDYLDNAECKIANPGQSSFSIVVGSVNHLSLDNDHWKSIGEANEIAAYSRTGTGIWGHIKPDVVEYGGGLKVSKNGFHQIVEKDTATELLRSTLDGGSAFNKEVSGTSFAAPKVSSIAAELLKLYKDENINLIRALIAQGARLPDPYFRLPTQRSVERLGYGIPSLNRVTDNNDYRVTFYNTKKISAGEGQIYSLKIPDDLRRPENEYEILIEVTLAYTAKTRRTRQRTKSYLATWLSWSSSKLDDTYKKFKESTLKEIEGEKIEKSEDDGENAIPWKIRERDDWGIVNGMNRNRSTLQKDWAIVNSSELPDSLHFAVKAHKGWDRNFEPIPYAITVSLEILGQNIQIY